MADLPIIEEPPSPQILEPDELEQFAKKEAAEIFNGTKLKPSEIGPYLGKNKSKNAAVLKEFCKLFDFKGMALDEAFRHFLTKFSLVGETQEIDRIVEQFSRAYCEAHPDLFLNWSVAHTVVSSMLILNTDLHSNMVHSKMSRADFISNTNMALLLDERLPEDFLKKIYQSVKNHHILLTLDEEDPRRSLHSSSGIFRSLSTLRSFDTSSTLPSRHSREDSGGSHSHSQSRLSSEPSTLLEGMLIRKNVLEASGKKAGNRQWKAAHCVLNEGGLYFYKSAPPETLSQSHRYVDFQPIRHVIASFVQGYSEDRPFVFSILTHTGALTYFQAQTEKETFEWIEEVNYVAARFSHPALAAAIGSQNTTFVPPILPMTNSKFDLNQQKEYLRNQIKKTDEEIWEHVKVREEIEASGGGKGTATLKRLTDWDQKMSFLNAEVRRYNEYLRVLSAREQKGALPHEELTEEEPAQGPSPQD